MAIFSTHIGLNYVGTQNPLAGCINDANDWAAWSKSIGVSSPVLLIEGEATKAGILGAVSRLLASLKAGDWGVLTYSGHGTQVPDNNNEEEDHYDEAICPYDLNRNLITDDELANAFSELPQRARLLFVSDCCHSGTLTRAVVVDSPLDELPRSIPFETLCTQMCLSTIDRVHREARAARSLPRSPIALWHLAGCQDNQVSYDAQIGGRARGAFTAYALAAIANKAKGFTFDAWKSGTRAYLPSNRYPQAPQFNGDLSQVVPGYEPTPQPPSNSASTGNGILTLDGRTYDVVLRRAV